MGEIAESAAQPAAAECPGLVIMVGVQGSGKSYLARTLSAALGADLLQTDAVRKEMFPRPRYTTAESRAVYDACHERITDALAEGRRVVFDGMNLRERQRQALYDLAAAAQAPALIVVASAPESVIRERLQRRAAGADPHDFSDADWQVYLRTRGQVEPVLRTRGQVEPVPRPHILVNTTTGPEPLIRLLRRELGC